MFEPKFTITPEINTRIAEIERLRTIIDHARILPELAVQLRFRATVEVIHSSTSIEGNPLNESQVRKLLQGNVVTAPDYAIQEVLNYKRALDWLQKTKKSNMTMQDVLEVHHLLMEKLLPREKIGHWRPGPVYVVDEIHGKEVVRYTGPESKDVPKLVASFLEWIPLQLQASLHPVLVAGLIHYIFVSIHPFSDGNGRTTRLLTQQYLEAWGYDFKDSLSLDVYYLQHRSEYYDALSRGDTFDTRMAADLTAFLDFFTMGFLEVANSLCQDIQIGKHISEGQKPMRLSTQELTILDYVYQFRSITVKESIDILGATKRTAQRRLIGLVEKRILLTESRGPATRYVLVSSKRQN